MGTGSVGCACVSCEGGILELLYSISMPVSRQDQALDWVHVYATNATMRRWPERFRGPSPGIPSLALPHNGSWGFSGNLCFDSPPVQAQYDAYRLVRVIVLGRAGGSRCSMLCVRAVAFPRCRSIDDEYYMGDQGHWLKKSLRTNPRSNPGCSIQQSGLFEESHPGC